jgi:4-amino-4-deoxy-L-arabinose transferase-like glycosyltransferase
VSNLRSLASPERLRWLIPLAVFLGAFGLRLIGIGWGLPNELHNHSYHPDEPVIFGYSQSIEPTQYPWTPHFYNYGTLYLLALRVTSDMTAAYSGGFDPKDPKSVYAFIGRAEFAGRIVSALAGAGTVLIVLLMLRRFTTELGAVLGSLVIAFAPAHVVHSRFQTVDVFATFLLAVSVYFAVRILAPSEAQEADGKAVLKDALWSGVFAGLSAGTKYTGLLALLVLAVVLLMSRRPNRLVAGGAGLVAAVVTFMLVTPGVWADSERFARDFMFEMRHTSTGHGFAFEGTSSGFLYHLSNLFLGIGTIVTLVAIAGLVYAAWKRNPWAIALLLFTLAYYVLIGRAEVKFLRYTFPLYIGLAAGFGWLMGTANERKGWWHAVVGLGLVGLGGIDPGGLRSAVTYTGLMAGTDARDAAGRFFKQQSQAKDLVVGLANDPWFYTPALYPDTAQMRSADYARIDQPMREAQRPRVERFVPRDAAGNPLYDQRVQWDPRLVTEAKPEYVVFTNLEVADVQRLRTLTTRSPEANALVAQYEAFEKELQGRYGYAGTIGTDVRQVEDMMYVTPAVYVWKRKDLP